jgi:hypothetical protein
MDHPVMQQAEGLVHTTVVSAVGNTVTGHAPSHNLSSENYRWNQSSIISVARLTVMAAKRRMKLIGFLVGSCRHTAEGLPASSTIQRF